MEQRNMDINWPRQDPLESKLNMYERQIDQLFDFAYKDQDDIKTLFMVKDELHKCIDIIDKKIPPLTEKYQNQPMTYAHSRLEIYRTHGEAEFLAYTRYFNDNIQFILKAIEKNHKVLDYLSYLLNEKSSEIISDAIRKNFRAFEYVKCKDFKSVKKCKDFKSVARKSTLAAIEKNSRAFEDAHSDFKYDKDFILEAIEKNYHVLSYIPEKWDEDIDVKYPFFRNNRDFMVKAIQKNPEAIVYISDELREDRDFKSLIKLDSIVSASDKPKTESRLKSLFGKLKGL
jgi:hypothetical protein